MIPNEAYVLFKRYIILFFRARECFITHRRLLIDDSTAFQTETYAYFPGRFYSKLGKFLSVSISISRTTIRRSNFLLFLLNDPATWEGRRVNIRVRYSSFNRKVMWCYRGVGIFEPPDFFP